MEALLAYAPRLLQVSLLTASLAICGLFFATFMGAIGAMGKLAQSRYPREYVWVYTSIVRGIPDLVLIILIYYGFQDLLNMVTEPLGLGVWNISPFWAGALALGFIYGAYLTETFRGAYMAVSQGQKEAAAALGLGRFVSFFKVVLPQLIRHALSGYGNVFQVLIKSTAVVGVIGLQDLVGLAKNGGIATREPLLFTLFVFVLYLVFYYMVGFVFGILERRYAEVTR